MGWSSLFRFTLIYAVFFVVIPAWLLGRGRGRPWRLAAAQAFAITSFGIQAGTTALGLARLSLPGAASLLYVGVMAGLFYPRLRNLLRGCRDAGDVGLRLLDFAEQLLLRHKFYRRMAARVLQLLPFSVLVAAVLMIAGIFPVHNLRFLDLESYRRAYSLAVLSGGENWHPDLSIPLLFLPMVWSSLSSTAAIAFSRPVFLGLFAAAVGFTTRERTDSGTASLLATGLAGLAPAWLHGISNQPSAEMAAAFALLAIGICHRSWKIALLAVATGVSISTVPQVWLWVAVGIACAGFGALFSQALLQLHPRFRLPAKRVAAGILLAAICGRPRPPVPDGPYQYEAAAQACESIGKTYPHNAWLIVSPSQELAAIHGRGWHAELSEFVSRFTPDQLRDPTFRMPFPVADIFFFVEKKSLWQSRDEERIRSARIDLVLDPAMAAYNSPLERTTLQFQASELLEAYAESHSDIQTIYAGESLVIYRIAAAIDAKTAAH